MTPSPRQYHYYRDRLKPSQRLLFRGSEIVGVFGRDLTLDTIYGSTYHVTTLEPEESIEDVDPVDDGKNHVFHWTPTWATP